MENNYSQKVKKLNELYAKSESEYPLTDSERNEQSVLRDEIINYLRNIITKNQKS